MILAMHPLLSELSGGDRRSIGKADEVVDRVLKNPKLLSVLFDGMLSPDRVIRMRCADAAEKVSSKCPEYLEPYKEKLIHQIAKIDQQEVHWHVAQMLPRLELDQKERVVVFSILIGYLNDKSNIVKTFSMQALADLAKDDKDLRRKVIPLLQDLMETGSPAMKSRGKKLLKELL